MKQDHVACWVACLERIKDSIPEQAYATWFAPIEPLKLEGKQLTVQVPTSYFYEFLEANYADELASAVYEVLGGSARLTYRVKIEEQQSSTVDYPTSSNAPSKSPSATSKEVVKGTTPFESKEYEALDPRLNEVYTFDTFFEGCANKYARSSAVAIAKRPGKTPFNPFFLHGPSGTGKTHLLHAIGNKIKEIDPAHRVLYVSAHLLSVQYGEATSKNNRNDFISFYQSVDTLIIDDVQEMMAKVGTQTAFFHIFNHLHQLGKQIILASDKAPVDLQGVEERLVTRMKWGLISELEPPDMVLRRRILNNKVKRDGLSFPKAVVDYIAENVRSNVRDLEGVIISLMARAVVDDAEIDLELAQRVVRQSVRLEEMRPKSVETVLNVVCEYFSVPERDVQSSSRKKTINQVRQVAMYLSKKYTDKSLNQIGTMIGKRDHSTVLHACNTVRTQLEIDSDLQAQVGEIERKLVALTS